MVEEFAVFVALKYLLVKGPQKAELVGFTRMSSPFYSGPSGGKSMENKYLQ